MSNGMIDRRGKRADVLRGAQQVFSERGFAGASMDAIAEAAKVSKRTLYHHFSSKEELLQTIVSDFLTSLDRGPAPEYRPGSDLRDDLRQFARREIYLVDSPERRGLSRLLTTTFLHDTGFGFNTRGQHDPHAALVAWIEAAVDDHVLAADDAALAARIFYSLVEGGITWPALMTDGASLATSDRVLDELIEVVLARYGTSA